LVAFCPNPGLPLPLLPGGRRRPGSRLMPLRRPLDEKTY
jgi:hypothetical protein